MTNCKVCSEQFESDKSLHLHLKKHGLFQAEYYCTYFPRKSLLHGSPIPFKSKNQYFSTDFIDYAEFLLWLNSQTKEKQKQICLERLAGRIKEKEYRFAPFHNELKTLELPPLGHFKSYFGSYSAACREIGVQPLFGKPLTPEFHKPVPPNTRILVDTREQDPLPFKNSRTEKLYIGDYLLDSDYSYTYVDRKSENDFLGTMTSGLERFEREIHKTVALNGYLFVVVESSIDNIYKNAGRFSKVTTMEYVFHNMRKLCHTYPRRIQFLFTGNRAKSIEIIPKLLKLGKELWETDIQYFLDSKTANTLK